MPGLEQNILILIIFFAIIFLIWWIIISKRELISTKFARNSKIKVIEIKPLGNGSKLILFEVGNRSFLISVNKGSNSNILEL